MKLLIIDDVHEYLEAAKNSFSEHEVITASSYEEAEEIIEHTTLDGVITDLFFPSVKNWVDLILSLAPMPGCEDYHQEALNNVTKDGFSLNTLNENPSGLGIAKLCYEEGIPFVIVSQGDRHFGNLGVVRTALSLTGFITGEEDPFLHGLGFPGSYWDKEACENRDVDKTSRETWHAALKLLRKPLKERVKK